MKTYPSISRAIGSSYRHIPNAFVFDKLDGSCMRSEWSSKRGWYKHGRRNGLIDDSNPQLKIVPLLFEQLLADSLTCIAKKNNWKHLIVFYEFWGSESFAGQHGNNDEKHLSLFDAVPNKQGFLSPAEFIKIFDGQVETAKYLGCFNWTRGFVEKVRLNQIDGITFEGVVAKAGSKHNIVRAKAKTQAWIDKVLSIHGEIRGRKIIES